MGGLRLVGFLMLALGGFLLWEVAHGQSPLGHLQQLVDLFGHQHVSGGSPGPAFPFGPADRASSAGNSSNGAAAAAGATTGGAGSGLVP